MDTDNFVLSFSEGNVDNKYMNLSNLGTPIKTNNRVPGEFKHELGSREIKEFIVFKPKIYSLVIHGQNRTAKEKTIMKENNAKHEDYYNALMDNEERIVEEYRIQKVGDKMSTIKTKKRILNNFFDKRFIKIILKAILMIRDYIFLKDLIKKINTTPIELLLKFGLDEGEEALINNIRELTINDDIKLIEAAIRLYNDL